MSQPFPPPSPEQPDPHTAVAPRSRSRWQRLGLLLLGGGVVVGAIAAAACWRFMQTDLLPLVEVNLSQALDRPVRLGRIERFSWTGMQISQSIFFPTREDASWITVRRIHLEFDPLVLIGQQTLRVNITLHQPTLRYSRRWDTQEIALPQIPTEFQGAIHTQIQSIQIVDGTLFISPATDLSQVRSPISPSLWSELFVQHLDAFLQFKDNYRVLVVRATGKPNGSGQFNLAARLQTNGSAATVTLQTQDMAIANLNPLLPGAIAVQQGTLSGQVTARLRAHHPPVLQGAAQIAGGVVAIAPGNLAPVRQELTLQNLQGRLRFGGQQIHLDGMGFQVGNSPVVLGGAVHLTDGLALEATLPGLELSTLAPNLPVAVQGVVQVQAQIKGAFDRPHITGTLTNRHPLRVHQVGIQTLTAEFAGTPEQVSLTALQVIPVGGGRIAGSGSLRLEQQQVAAQLQAVLPLDQLVATPALPFPAERLGVLAAQITVAGALNNLQADGRWQIRDGTYPSRGTAHFASGVVTVDAAEIRLGRGRITAAAQAWLDSREWRAVITSDRLPAQPLGSALPGVVPAAIQERLTDQSRLSGTLQLAGRLDDLTLQGMRGRGTFQLLGGIRGLPGDIQTAIAWSGRDLVIDTLAAPGLTASGVVRTKTTRGALALAALDLHLHLHDVDLQSLSAWMPVPASLTPAGRVNLEGRLLGTLEEWGLHGQATLQNLVVNSTAIAPTITAAGHFASTQGGALEVRGLGDRLSLHLDRQFRPAQFEWHAGAGIAQGQMTGNRLQVKVSQFPLDIFHLTPAAPLGIGEIGGTLSGQMTADLSHLTAPVMQGEVAIANPRLGHLNHVPGVAHQDDRLMARFTYANGMATLYAGRLDLGSSTYTLTGQATVEPDFQWMGELQAEDADIQDLLTALHWFEWADVGRWQAPPWEPWRSPETAAGAAALQPLQPRTLPAGSLSNQLADFTATTPSPEAPAPSLSVFPALRDLEGQFSTRLQVQASVQKGITAALSVHGHDWQWGTYGMQQLMLDGAWEGDRLTVQTAVLQGLTITDTTSDWGEVIGTDTRLAFQGEWGRFLSGQMQVQHLPLTLLNQMVTLPVLLAGEVEGQATLTGTPDNPVVKGEATVVNGWLADIAIDDIATTVTYRDALLRLDGRLITEIPGSLHLMAQIPVALPWMAIAPPRNDILMDLNARNQGLALIDRLTRRQVSWLGGEGEVDIHIGGTLDTPEIEETTTFRNAQIRVAALSDSIANLNGQVRLRNGRIRAAEVQGEFGQGRVRLFGELPAFLSPQAVNPSPLTLLLENVRLDYSTLYTGDIQGSLVVNGTLLHPILSGDLILSHGRLTLSPVLPQINLPPLDNLQITLGDRLELTSNPPLFALQGEGTLALSGSFPQLQPRGTVQIASGYVNLLTTRFHVSHLQDNQVRVSPERGLDPHLDVQLLALIPETRTARIDLSSGFPVAEYALLSPVRTSNRLESIRVDAAYAGYVSRLLTDLDQVMFRSLPHRDRTELVELMGGRVTAGLVEEEELFFLASVADVLVSTIPEIWIERRFGLFEFNLFPVGIIEDDGVDSLELGVEVSVELSDRLTASVLDVMTLSDTPELILRYQVTPDLRWRGFSNFADNSGMFVQFDTEF